MNNKKIRWPVVLLLSLWPGLSAQLYAESVIEEPPRPLPDAADVLLLAENVGQWLIDNAIREPRGISWPDDALHPGDVGYDLASGVAGKAVYFAALYRATGRSDYLDTALGAADYLVSVVADPASFANNLRRASLYTGIAGIGVALLEATELSAESRYDKALAQVVERLQAWSITDAAGTRWNDEFNDLLYGDTGTTLFLATLAARTGDQAPLQMARQGARFLLSQAQHAPGGSFWLFRRSQPYNLPNFSHGTAGVAYVLATVGSLSSDASLLGGARAGFEYIRSIAEVDAGMLRIPYGWGADSWDGLYEFGWAHGLSGDAMLFQRLQQAGVEPQLAAEYELLVRNTLQNIGLPGAAAEPFAEPSTPLDQRFGRAGVLALLSQWSADAPAATGVADLRNAFWHLIESAAVRNDGRAHWVVDAPEFVGGGRAAYTGLFHGAAGIGLAVLRMHSSMTMQPPYLLLPDDAAAWTGSNRSDSSSRTNRMQNGRVDD